MPSRPLLFISHKHTDRTIAEVLASFFSERSNGAIEVFLSSDPRFEGPRFGRGLNSQLREALWQADVLVLVYTSSDEDWSYCMYECGVATQPNSPNTNAIVFQCGPDIPAPFQDELRVNARSEPDIRRFADQFFRQVDFFPSRNGEALAPNLRDDQLDKAAKEWFKAIKEVLPQGSDVRVEESPMWPFMQLELPEAEVERFTQAPAGDREARAQEIVLEHAVVLESDAGSANLFGRAKFPIRMKFETLLTEWKQKNPGAMPDWFSSCCSQMAVGARNEFPVIRWTPLREADGEREFTPVLTRVRRLPFARTVQFDVFFYDLSDPRAIPVRSKMIRTGDFFALNMGESGAEGVSLTTLLHELDQRRLNRVPILSKDGRVLYIVHRSMIDRFMTQEFIAKRVSDPDTLSLEDLLANKEMRTLFESTFVVVANDATLASARTEMLSKSGCSDIFVTSGGGADEPVLGWLTNVDMVRGA